MGKRSPKTRNAGTMTESAFWSMIRSVLRKRSMYWKPIAATKQAAKRDYTGPNKLQKFEYQCNKCKEWFAGKEVEVDHINEVGSLTCATDLPTFVENLFAEDGYELLCKTCHKEKTFKK